jgi:hypothetical protein
MMKATTTLLLISVGMLGCRRASPPANPEFSDALVFAFKSLEGDAADMAYAVRLLERETYVNVDVMASKTVDRSLAPERLSEEDIGSIKHPDRPVSDALPIAVVDVSAFEPTGHQHIQMMTDQTPVEPYSPTHYIREFIDGEDCWVDQECEWLRTWNDLTKENFLMTLDYQFGKDFRWIDLNLPNPESLAEGEEAVNTGESRWAFVSRSWNEEEFSGRQENSHVHQSFTLDIWIPRDGGGYTYNSDDVEGEWTTDSNGGGTLRVTSLWTETSFDGLNVSDDAVIATTREGIQKNITAAEDWLIENDL